MLRSSSFWKVRAKLPVQIENDANAAALSELWYGPLEVSRAHSLLFVLVVDGIGTGFILNGELHIGSSVGSGGFGHISMDPRQAGVRAATLDAGKRLQRIQLRLPASGRTIPNWPAPFTPCAISSSRP